MADILALLAYPFIAAIIFVGMHTWLGLQVLRRGVVFADLALAQLSALGATVAVVIGHAPGSAGGFGYALLFTFAGAVLLTLSRRIQAEVSQEALIGIVYVVATALTVLVVDRSPQGAEHVKRMLVGNILTVGPADVAKLTLLYGAVALVHGVFRRPMLAAAGHGEQRSGLPVAFWDLVFYGSFGLVVTSSVALAGVLLVFSFLIIPAVIGSLFSRRTGVALLVGWGAGILASLTGLAASVVLDAPTGAAMVVAFAVLLVAAALVRSLLVRPAPIRRLNLKRAALAGAAALALAVMAQGIWLVAQPAGDQPLLAAFETLTGLGPEHFLTPSQRRTYAEAAETERRHQAEVEHLRTLEREARWKGAGLAEEDLRRVASFQQSFNEMGRGERFVQDHLRATARARERWYVGVPAIVLSALALALLALSRNPWRGRTKVRRA